MISKYKNYHYNETSRILFRVLDNKKQLLWQPPYNGVPCFNKEVWDEYKGKTDYLGYKLDGKRFICNAKEFELHCKEINYREPQVAVDCFWWYEI